MASRFLNEIPEDLLENENKSRATAQGNRFKSATKQPEKRGYSKRVTSSKKHNNRRIGMLVTKLFINHGAKVW